ncbi:DUF1542 domain-containing protein [Lactobacillus hominis]|uniref:DUF1542 domain-containing protein n=2 Tax=Lactobacillus hominis TaxID=1203033 RepID=UPI0023F54343|nr:DUF1542 domain-containing protein [Lactobacillus hominis]
MVSKNNKKMLEEKMRDEKQRFSIRKFSIGAASVLIGLSFMAGGQSVSAATNGGQQEATGQDTNVDQTTKDIHVTTESEVKSTAQVNETASEEKAPKASVQSASSNENAEVSSTTPVDSTKAAPDNSDSNKAKTPVKSSAIEQASDKKDEKSENKSSSAETVKLNVEKAKASADKDTLSKALGESKAKAAVQDENSVTVTDAQGLINAIQKENVATINVANDINLGTITDKEYNYVPSIKNRDFTIQSATSGTKHTIDFSGYCFNMSSQNSVTFKDLNIYSRTYWGVVYNAGGYTFDNVDFTGSQLVYTKPSINSTVTFKNTVNATAVGSYTSPLDGKTRSSQGGNNQQILQFEGGNNKIIFDEGSNVTLTTTNSNVLEIDGGTTNIEVKNGANVKLNPHSKGKPELLNGMDSGIVARAIASIGSTNLTIDKNANLNINLNKESSDQDLSGALYLKSGATINVNGNLNITSDGQSSYNKRADYVPVYINGTAAINVNGGSFKIDATNMGDSYTGPIVSSNGKSTIAINHHGTFDVTGDGAKATGVSLGSGSTFTSTQPELFNISMPDGATAIKNGKVQFKGVKTSADGQPIGEIDITYAANGTPTVTKVTSYDEATTTATRTAENNAKNKINLIAAGQEVDLKDITFTKDADGNYIMSGNANTAADTGAYVYISVNGTVKQVPTSGEQTLYTVGETGDPTSSQVPYTAETGADGKFSVNLGKLNDNDQVSLYAAKDFVTSDTDTKTVSDWMTSSYRDQLQKLVDEAPNVEKGSNYINATDNLKTAYTRAISAGSTLLQDSSATSEQLEAAANAIVNAKTALNGDLNKVKQDLQDAVDAASDFEKTSATYYNADTTKQKAYTNAVAAGSTALNDSNATVDSLTAALKNINNAKNALDGQPTNKQDLQNAVDESKDVKNSNNYTNADPAAKTAYDDAVTAAQSVLDNKNATQAQVNQALQDLNTANGKLNGDAKTDAANRQALEDAVEDAPNVRNTPAYYNGGSKVQDAYNKAITDGQAVLDKSNATPAEVKNALDAITNAKAALDGQPTNKDALQDAVNKSKDIKNSNNYTNADQNAKTAYDNAVTAAQSVLDDKNATQAQVTQALKDLNTANGKLNGDAKTEAANRATLEDAVKEAPTVEKTSSKYYNGTEKAQNDYKNAVSEGQKVLDNPSATADQIKTALDNINAAKGALDGDPTNKTTLQNSVDNAVDLDKSNADAQAKQDYTDALDKANQVLADPNATQQAVNEANTALTNAKTALDNSSALQNAKDALQQAVYAKSTTEKTPAYYNADSAKQQAYDTAISAGTDALNAQNPTVESLTTALNKINEAKNALDGKATDTSKLTAAVNNADTVKAGNDYKDASADVQKQYDDAVKAGQQLLDPTTAPSPLTQADVDRATKAITDAQRALTTSATTNVKDAKEKATADLTTAVDAAKKAIDQDTNLTEDERNAAKAQVEQDASAAKEAINNATTNDAVTSAATAGKVAIDKTVANAAIDNAAAGKNKAIDESSLTDEEKNGIKDQVAQAVKNAKGEISAANTEQAVKDAQNAGVAAIDGIKVPSTSTQKEEAKDNINKAADAAKNEIDQDSNLTDDQKQAAKDQIDNDAKNAQNAIDDAKNDTDVNNAIDAGKLAIDKTVANAAIDNEAAGKNKEIAGSPLTTDEQNKWRNQVANEVKNAKDNINSATTPAEVTTAQKNGVDAIKGIQVPTTSPEKDKAKENLDKQVQDAKDAIDQDSNLTDDQKQAAKNQIDTDAKNAQDAIDNAKTNDDVKKATDAGQLGIDKTVANAAIDNEAAGKLKEIKDPLTDEEKKTYTDLVNDAANNAKQNIANATTPEAVTKAQEDGVNAIDKINVPTTSPVKDAANKAIDEALKNKEAEINNATNITDQEKQDFIKQATDAANKAHDNINKATTTQDVETAQTNGEKAIADVTVPGLSDVKKESTDLINKALDKKKDEINNASNLSNDEKQQLINDATKAATDAINNVNNAKTNDEAKQAADTGDKKIEDVKIPSLDNAKKDANQAIDDALKSKTNEINNASNLSQDEKQDLIKKATDEANTAKDNIAKATTNDDVKKAEEDGVEAIRGVNFTNLDDAKKAATDAIDNALTNKTNEINNASNLSQDEKQDLIKKATDEANTAKDNIAKATTNDAVTNAQNKGIEAIANVPVPSLDEVKQNAINAIKQVQEAKNKQIADATNLSPEEQKNLTDQVNKIADDAIAKINDPATTTNDAVKTARDNAIDQITNLFIPTLDSAKRNANDAIDNAVKSKTDEINKASNLSDKAKQDLIDKVNKAAETAKENIKNATTNDGVKDAETQGLDAINNVKVPSLAEAKDSAVDEIKSALNSKLNEINNATYLPQAQRDSLTEAANKAANDAIGAITAATTNDQVSSAKQNGLDAIAKVVVPADTTGDSGNAGNDTNDQAALNNAKDSATQAIDQALANKVNEINNASHLSDSEKAALITDATDAANTAKANISNARDEQAVELAKNNGIAAINAITIPSLSDKKDSAITEIDKAANAKNEEINRANLSASQKEHLRDLVSKSARDAKANIGAATSDSGVDAALAKGLAAINAIKVGSVNANGLAGVNGQNANANASRNADNAKSNSNASRKELPQTGARENNAGVIGLAVASLAGLIGLAGTKKRKND